MTNYSRCLIVTILTAALAPCAAGAREPAVVGKAVAKISAGFEYCLSTRREQSPTCPMRRSAQAARSIPPAGIPNGVFQTLARELDAGAAASYDGIETPAAWCAHDNGQRSGGIHALCALGSFEQRNFDMLTIRKSEDGIATYPQLRVSIAGVTNYLRHISEARLQGGFTSLSAAAARASDKASADVDAGYRAWFTSVQAQAAFVGERLEQRMISVANGCPRPTVGGGCEAGNPDTRGGISSFDVLATFAELGAPALRTDLSLQPQNRFRVSFPPEDNTPARELLVAVWAAQAADDHRRRVHDLIASAQLTSDRELIEAASEYAAAAMSQVTERAAQCALLCMDEAGLGDNIPVPMPIAADLTIPMTFVR
jgi:hypothetical protein